MLVIVIDMYKAPSGLERETLHIFSAWQHIWLCYSALYAIARSSMSVCLSVCHTGGSVKNSWS